MQIILKRHPFEPDQVKQVRRARATSAAFTVNNREMPDICLQHMVADDDRQDGFLQGGAPISRACRTRKFFASGEGAAHQRRGTRAPHPGARGDR